MVAKRTQSPYKKKLQELGQHWKGAKQDIGLGLPEGNYRMWLISGELGESESSGRLQITWIYKVAEGEQAGQQHREYQGVDSPESLPWLARRLARLEYEIDDFEDLEELEDILENVNKNGPYLVQVKLQEKDGFLNTRLNKLLDPEDFEDLVSPDYDPRKGTAKESEKPPSKPKPESRVKASEPEEEEEGEEGDGEEEIDFISLGKDADKGDKAAIKQLKSLAKEYGVNPDDFDSWRKTSKAVAEAMATAEEEEETDKDDDEPKDIVKGARLWFMHKGKAQEGIAQGKPSAAGQVKVKLGDDSVISIDADRCEILDVPF